MRISNFLKWWYRFLSLSLLYIYIYVYNTSIYIYTYTYIKQPPKQIGAASDEKKTPGLVEILEKGRRDRLNGYDQNGGCWRDIDHTLW